MGKVSKQDEAFLKKLGLRIRDIRKEKKITQVALAYQCDFEKPNMRRIEAGKTNPTVLTLKKICTALDISIKELFNTLEKE